MGCLTYNCTSPLAARNMVALAQQRSLQLRWPSAKNLPRTPRRAFVPLIFLIPLGNRQKLSEFHGGCTPGIAGAQPK